MALVAILATSGGRFRHLFSDVPDPAWFGAMLRIQKPWKARNVMKKSTRRNACLALLGCAATLGFTGQGVAATVTANDVYLRSYVKSYTVGSLKKGQTFHVEYSRSGFHYGYANGDFKGCAWVATGDVKPGGGQNSPKCPPRATTGGPETLINGGFSTRSPYPSGSQDALRTKYISCNSAGMYGNYRRGKHYEKFLDLPKNTPVKWRYESADHRSTMILNHANTDRRWGFVRSSCLSDQRS